MTNLTNLFDEYALRARVYPSLLAILPIAVTFILVWPVHSLKELWTIAAAAGCTFFLANYIRSRGKRLESRLVKKWDGLPTTHMLRYREVDNPVSFRRRRKGLEKVFGERLPSREEESADSAAADEAYVAAIKVLISRVRSDTKKYPRVHEENIHYGYRRNLLAIKTTSIIVICLLTIADLGFVAVKFRPLDIVAIGFNAAMALAWLVVVKEQWVHEAGKTYAERLFETLEQDGLTT